MIGARMFEGLVVAAMLALVAAAGAARAADEGAAPAGRYQRLDANGDSYVDRVELAAGADRAFDRLDTDRDGTITRDERLNAPRRQRAAASAGDKPAEVSAARRAAAIDRWIARVDADHDGRVSREEYRAYRSASFDRRDKDHDGRLAEDERPRRRVRSG